MILQALAKEKETAPALWRYTNLAPYTGAAFAAAPQPEILDLPAPLVPDGARLVFINGQLNEAASHVPEGLFRLSAADGALRLDVQASVCLAIDPLELLFINQAGDAPYEVQTDLSLKLAASARLTVIERHMACGAGAPFAHRLVLKAGLSAGAKLVHGRLVSGQKETLFFGDLRAKLAEGAMFDHASVLASGPLLRQTIDVTLAGRKASAHLTGLMLPGADEQADTLTFVRHAAPGGTSRQLFKTVISDNGRGVFHGLVRVEKGADQTDAAQTSRALLLSGRAEMDAQPELEIFADDVACSHGSAVGDLDQDMLFYLQSRGIPESEARRLLVRAFLVDGVDAVLPPPFGAAATQVMEDRLASLFHAQDERISA